MRIGLLTVTVTVLLASWPASGQHLGASTGRGEAVAAPAAATAASPTIAEPCYLTQGSQDPRPLFGHFEPFTNRFTVVDALHIRDHLLRVTWLVLPESADPGALPRLDWASAQKLAATMRARLPMLKELKTLIIRERDPQAAAFIPSRFFPLSQRTRRCWSAEPSSPLTPFHRYFVDFASPAWGETSMSEQHCVLLIQDY